MNNLLLLLLLKLLVDQTEWPIILYKDVFFDCFSYYFVSNDLVLLYIYMNMKYIIKRRVGFDSQYQQNLYNMCLCVSTSARKKFSHGVQRSVPRTILVSVKVSEVMELGEGGDCPIPIL
jgi:hypothetical protein